MGKVAFLVAMVGLASVPPAIAQVINGESTYDNNYQHTPPGTATDAPARDRSRSPATPERRDDDHGGDVVPPY